jgi:hypothetical protein
VFGLKRVRRIPADSRPKLDRDERVLGWARAEPSGVVVVTTRGVFLPGRDRLGWHEIHKATWANSHLTVIPSRQVGEGEGYAVMADADPVMVALPRPDDVPAEVRTRVTRSVAYTAHHDVPGGGLRVVARRIAGRNGVLWHVRYDEGTDPADPEVVASTALLVAEASAPDPTL